MTKLYVTAASWRGCVRSNNEDMILVGRTYIRNEAYRTMVELRDGNRLILAIADGMGGHNSGEEASSEALHNLQFFYNDIPAGLNDASFRKMINEWLDSINMIFDSKGRVNEKLKGMGTTLVAIACYEGRFYYLNCGDSRLYRLRQGKLSQLTTDHSLEKETGERKHSSIVTNCIGGGCKSSFFDIVEMTGDFLHDDIYLLCSDGLTDMLRDHEIELLLNQEADANVLCEAAIEVGGLDNVSACVIDVEFKEEK